LARKCAFPQQKTKEIVPHNDYNPSDNPVAGFVAFSNVIQNPNSALEMLDLSGNTKSDQTLVSFAQALTSNKMLRKIGIGVNTPSWYNAFKISGCFLSPFMLQIKHHGHVPLEPHT